MSDLRDFTGKNRRFTGTQSIDLPTGTTGQRDTGHGSGALRFNSTTGLMEYYTGTDWKAVDSPPNITGFALMMLVVQQLQVLMLVILLVS